MVNNLYIFEIGIEDSSSPSNTFRNLNNGIISRDCNLVVHTPRFKRIDNYDGDLYGIGLDENGNSILVVGHPDADLQFIQTGLGNVDNPTYPLNGNNDFITSIDHCHRGVVAFDINVDISKNKMLKTSQWGIIVLNCKNKIIHVYDNNIEAMIDGIWLSNNSISTNQRTWRSVDEKSLHYKYCNELNW